MAQIFGQKSPFGGLCNCVRQKWGHANLQRQPQTVEDLEFHDVDGGRRLHAILLDNQPKSRKKNVK